MVVMPVQRWQQLITVIGTVKLHGSSIWNFIGTFFKNIFNGCRDYVNMVPLTKSLWLQANVKFTRLIN